MVKPLATLCKQVLIAMCCTLVLVASGCTNQNQSATPHSKAANSYMIIKDDAQRSIELVKKPERIVVLSPSFLELLYAVDGRAIGRPSSRTADIPAAAKALPEVGFVYNVNTENLVALKPDLVIGFLGMHEKLLPLLESSKIPVILFKMKNYEDLTNKVKLFSEIAGTTAKGTALVAEMDKRLQAVTDKLPPTAKKIAILHATAKSVTLELEGSIAGDIAKRIKLRNIAAGSRPLEANMDATPYSLEKLVEQDPDMLLVVSMGQSAEIEKRLRSDVENNPAWATLRAVREKQVVFLPSELFLLHPGVRMAEAVEHMAKVVYPEVY